MLSETSAGPRQCCGSSISAHKWVRPSSSSATDTAVHGCGYSQANFTAKSSATAINIGEHSRRRPAITLIST